MQRCRGSRGSGGVQGGEATATATDMAYNNGRRNKSPSSTTNNNHKNNKMESSESPAGQQNSLRFGKLFQVSQSVYITITVLYICMV